MSQVRRVVFFLSMGTYFLEGNTVVPHNEGCGGHHREEE
jgi:hypothetical protein